MGDRYNRKETNTTIEKTFVCTSCHYWLRVKLGCYQSDKGKPLNTKGYVKCPNCGQNQTYQHNLEEGHVRKVTVSLLEDASDNIPTMEPINDTGILYEDIGSLYRRLVNKANNWLKRKLYEVFNGKDNQDF